MRGFVEFLIAYIYLKAEIDDYKCTNCEKVLKSKAGLKRHATLKHKDTSSKAEAQSVPETAALCVEEQSHPIIKKSCRNKWMLPRPYDQGN